MRTFAMKRARSETVLRNVIDTDHTSKGWATVMPEEILSLSTIAERQTVNIESKKFPAGKLYEFSNLADLGPFEYGIIVQRDAELAKLRSQKKKLTPTQERLFQKILDDTVKLVVRDVEPFVLAALTPQQKELLVVTWSQLILQGAAEGNARTSSRRTTGASSRGSKRSTAATRKRGSTPQRGR